MWKLFAILFEIVKRIIQYRKCKSVDKGKIIHHPQIKLIALHSKSILLWRNVKKNVSYWSQGRIFTVVGLQSYENQLIPLTLPLSQYPKIVVKKKNLSKAGKSVLEKWSSAIRWNKGRLQSRWNKECSSDLSLNAVE